VQSGVVPSIVVHGDYGRLGYETSFKATGARSGIALVMPLYQSRTDRCDTSMKLQNELSKLEIAEQLVTTGAMTEGEFLELARKIKQETFGLDPEK